MGFLWSIGRWATSTFFHFGAALGAALLTGLTVLMVQVVAPLCIGASWQIVRTILRLPGNERSDAIRALRSSPAAYAIVSGTAWATAYAVLRGLLAVGRPIVALVGAEMGIEVPAWLSFLAVVTVLFVVGASVGLLAQHHEAQRRLDG